MEIAGIAFEGFELRTEALEGIKRYIHPGHTDVMYYRTNVGLHARRVLQHLDGITPFVLGAFGERIDMKRARTLALVHDDY